MNLLGEAVALADPSRDRPASLVCRLCVGRRNGEDEENQIWLRVVEMWSTTLGRALVYDSGDLLAKVSKQSNTNGTLLGCMKAIRGCRTKRMGHVVVLRPGGKMLLQ